MFGVDLAEGLMVWEVEKGSLADNRILPGTIITEVNFKPVRKPFDFAEIYRDADLSKGLVVAYRDADGHRGFVILKDRDL